jgi:beta-glucosidase
MHGNALRGLHAAICRCPEPVSKWIERLQFYLNFPAIEGAPLIALRGFQRIHLDRGATQKVHFHLNPRDLDMVTEISDAIIAEGDYTISIGGGQPDADAPGRERPFHIDGHHALLE